jgi:hypothetical protein
VKEIELVTNTLKPLSELELQNTYLDITKYNFSPREIYNSPSFLVMFGKSREAVKYVVESLIKSVASETDVLQERIARDLKLNPVLNQALLKKYINDDKVEIPLVVLKLYQVCDKELLKRYIGDDELFGNLVKKVDYYIGENCFELTGVAKLDDISKKNSFMIDGTEAKSPFIVPELLSKIFSYLPQVLWDIRTGKKVEVKTEAKIESKSKTFDDLKEIVSKFYSQFNSETLNTLKKIFSTENKDNSDITVLKKLLAIHDENLTEVVVKGYCQVTEIDFSSISGENNEFNVNDL